MRYAAVILPDLGTGPDVPIAQTNPLDFFGFFDVDT